MTAFPPAKVPASRVTTWNGFIWVALTACACWLLAAWAMPLVQDEAYYFTWANHLQFGYFDHPPGVALMSWPATWAHASPLIARLGTVLTAALTMAAALRLFRILGLRSGAALTTAMLLTFGNVLGLVLGVITTPDTGLMLAWVVALSEGALALQGQPKRWLSAGLATGLGFMAKYMMVLIGPVFLWALVAQLRQDRRRAALKTVWPYLGGCVALLVVLPHLAWNADNDWITMRFQLRHGFASSHMRIVGHSDLPKAEEAQVGSREWTLAQAFKGPLEEEKKKEPPTAFDPYLKAVNRCFSFLGSQLSFWGALLGVMLWTWGRRWKDRTHGASERADEQRTEVDPRARPLILAAAAVPLAFFGLLSLGSSVEANWSAMYVFGAAALLTPGLIAKRKALWGAFAVNIALLALVVGHAVSGLLPLKPSRDRVLKESHGYEALGRYVSALKGPLFAETYQLTSMMSFYGDGRQVDQWPGMTRDSEFIRQPQAALGLAQVRQQGGFWLVSASSPPHIPGFRAEDMAQLRDCKEGGLQVISTIAAQSELTSHCPQPIHEWFLVRYETEPSHE